MSRQKGLRSDKNVINFNNLDLILLINLNVIMLAKKLNKLPLALATARAYLDQVAVSLSDYLRLYQQS